MSLPRFVIQMVANFVVIEHCLCSESFLLYLTCIRILTEVSVMSFLVLNFLPLLMMCLSWPLQLKKSQNHASNIFFVSLVKCVMFMDLCLLLLLHIPFGNLRV